MYDIAEVQPRLTLNTNQLSQFYGTGLQLILWVSLPRSRCFGTGIVYQITITGSIPLLVDQIPRVSSAQQSVLRHWHSLLYNYHWVDTSAGGLLDPEGIIRPVVVASALAQFIIVPVDINYVRLYKNFKSLNKIKSRYWTKYISISCRQRY